MYLVIHVENTSFFELQHTQIKNINFSKQKYFNFKGLEVQISSLEAHVT